MSEHKTKFDFKGKGEHISNANANIPNTAHQHQHIDTETLHGTRDHVIVPDAVRTTFNLDIESIEETHSVVSNVGRALVKKIVLMFGSNEINTINHSDIYGTYKNLYLSRKSLKRS